MSGRRIAYAYFDPKWDRMVHPIAQLVRAEVEPLDYQIMMKDHLICPQCYEPLIRVPTDPKLTVMADGKEALFRHLPSEDAPYCLLRSGATIGKKYNNEEDAKKAIEDEDLIVISGFMQDRPENSPREDFDEENNPIETHYESKHGRVVELPISRHNGQTFKLPSKITSVQSLCVNFRQNYYREIHIVDEAGKVTKHLLCDSLKNINDINGEVNCPNFYFGEIVSIDKHMNHTTIWLKMKNPRPFSDFRVRVWNKVAEPRRMVKGVAEGRIVLFYSPIESVGSGYWTGKLNWGEIALLPAQYKDFLETDYSANKK
ncbi:hypothetical protein [Atlantibacter subterraneus]|uniref:hypothetical protein n=1 Tax=Atlantibacter subterraneus TaxID=255519 RepID=UPI0029647A5D|nr:hypothetical protein [Atlantibacter subterranea]MDW2741483.1 hypothetical protein [Atlantibacter subterranea]